MYVYKHGSGARQPPPPPPALWLTKRRARPRRASPPERAEPAIWGRPQARTTRSGGAPASGGSYSSNEQLFVEQGELRAFAFGALERAARFVHFGEIHAEAAFRDFEKREDGVEVASLPAHARAEAAVVKLAAAHFANAGQHLVRSQ